MGDDPDRGVRPLRAPLKVKWRSVPVGAGAASGTVPLPVGTAGDVSPRALIAAGVHGDEGPWGALAIRKLIGRITPDRLIGSLILLPVSNPTAMETNRRTSPLDSLDLNRCFPGDEGGTHTEMLAAAIVREALDSADVVIDLHGGGSWAMNAFAFSFPGGKDLALAIGAPFIVDASRRDLGSVTLTTQGLARGKRVVAVEMGGHSSVEDAWAERLADGVERALVAARVLKPDPKLAPAPLSRPVPPPIVLRPSRGGLFRPRLGEEANGMIVPKGTVLGTVVDPGSFRTLESLRAPFGETALLLIRPMLAVVEAGAMSYVVSDAGATT